MALEHLVTLALETERFLTGSTVKEIVTAYTGWGWKAMRRLLTLLPHSVSRSEEAKAVNGVIAVLYRPWLEKGLKGMQKAVGAGSPAKMYPVAHIAEPADGTCILFCDGLRYDVGQRLVKVLECKN